MTTQKEYLQDIKKALHATTWDALAEMAEVTPRALKTYRMPEESQDYRAMPGPVRKVFELLVAQQKR